MNYTKMTKAELSLIIMKMKCDISTLSNTIEEQKNNNSYLSKEIRDYIKDNISLREKINLIHIEKAADMKMTMAFIKIAASQLTHRQKEFTSKAAIDFLQEEFNKYIEHIKLIDNQKGLPF